MEQHSYSALIIQELGLSQPKLGRSLNPNPNLQLLITRGVYIRLRKPSGTYTVQWYMPTGRMPIRAPPRRLPLPARRIDGLGQDEVSDSGDDEGPPEPAPPAKAERVSRAQGEGAPD